MSSTTAIVSKNHHNRFFGEFLVDFVVFFNKEEDL